MRTLTSILFLLTLAFATQTAHAKLVLVFDDPATDRADIVVEDNSALDGHGWSGDIYYCQSAGNNMLCINVISKPEEGTATEPYLQVQADLIRWSGDLDILVTDTGFNNGPTTAQLYIDGENAGFDEMTFKYWGDPTDQPFGKTDLFYETTVDGDGDFTYHDFPEPGGIGSLTLEVNIRGAEENNTLYFWSGLDVLSSTGTVPVPDVVGLVQNIAEQAIEDAGLVVGNVTTQTSETVPTGTVISQDPVATTDVNPGTEVNLVVSEGTGASEVGNDAGLSGFWYDPELDGEGYNVVIGDGFWYVYYYGWRSDGQRLWLAGDVMNDHILYERSYTFNLSIGEQGTFQNPDPTLKHWGEMTIIFHTCGTGQVRLQGDDGTKTANISKVNGIGVLDCDS